MAKEFTFEKTGLTVKVGKLYKELEDFGEVEDIEVTDGCYDCGEVVGIQFGGDNNCVYHYFDENMNIVEELE